MKFEQLKNAMDSKFLDVQKNTICMDYLLDSIEMVMYNTYHIVMQIENKRDGFRRLFLLCVLGDHDFLRCLLRLDENIGCPQGLACL